MRWYRVSILLLPLSLAAATRADDPTEKDLQKFQGAWQAVAIRNADGQPAPEDDVRNTRLRVEGKRFTLTGKTFTVSGAFVIDATTTPKTIDVLLDSTGKPQEKILGIYRIDGDLRQSCFALPGNPRPREFAPAEKGVIGLEWKRQAP